MNVKFNGATLKQTIQFQGFIVIFHLFMLWEKLVHWDCIDCKYMYTSYVCQHIQFEEFILIILPVHILQETIWDYMLCFSKYSIWRVHSDILPVHILRETNYLRIYVLQVLVYKLCFSKYSVWRVHSDISPVHTFQETNYLRLYILQVQVYKLCFSKYSIWRVHCDISPVHILREIFTETIHTASTYT